MKKKPANRPLKYGEETQMIHIRVPKSKVDACLDMIKKWLSKYKVKNK